ncbi:VWA domain-containing protein [Xylophilus sp. Kf1]|nr:VWA domain-containing protein [Xylophilus sp. Kf1]
MLIDFFFTLRAARLPVSVTEYLALLEALQAGVVGPGVDGQGPAGDMEDFYHLARTVLVKDEKHFDRFDRAFSAYFQGVRMLTEHLHEVPEDWLRKMIERDLSPEQRAALKALGWDELMKTLQQRLEEQKGRHEGGSKWIGTGGTSPFGNGGVNPRGVRIGGTGGGRSAVKVWEQRAFRDYDDSLELGTRNIKVALRRLRRFARQGAADQFDLDGTIASTAANAGWLDIRMRPERRNNVKLLLLMDVGGTMDEHVSRVEELFSAVKGEFKHLEFFYFHNCVYDFVWKHNRRRFAEKIDTWDLMRRYGRDYKLVFVGDATMSPYEITQPGGSVEYHNEEPGGEWLQRLIHTFPHYAWINPEPQGVWAYRQSIGLVQQMMSGRMYPLSLKGLEDAMRLLSK